ncbi:MAG: Fic family protein [Planctomycetota bacterium]
MRFDPSPHLLGRRLDLLLAEQLLARGPHQEAMFRYRRARDDRWMQGLMALRGVEATSLDLSCALTRRPGRFGRDADEAQLIRGLRRAIDRIDESVELARPLDAEELGHLHAVTTATVEGEYPGVLRTAAPLDPVPGLEPPSAELLRVLLERFSRRLDLHDGAGSWGNLHPIDQAATLFRRLVLLAPFHDHNLIVACLATSWWLMARGYPPFLPRSADRRRLLADLAGSDAELSRRIARIVFRGFLDLRAG